MKLVIFGATGQVGKLLVELALATGHSVTAFCRNPNDLDLDHPRLRLVRGDATVAADVAAAVPGHDAVLSAVGARTRKRNTVRSQTMQNLLRVMDDARVQRLVWLSAAGVGDSKAQAQRSSFFFGRILMPLLLREVYADAAVADEMVRRSDLDWVVVRPVGLSNADAKGSVRAIADGSRIPKLMVPRADVARFMLEQAVGFDYLGQMPVICEP